ncbi:MAG: tetratricopeptide repeat protein, partial [Deltaproteobacteria bacterium]|nr:tetratricopeptide repeat protein [Deltaproteobacteria bacterium]
MHDHRNPAVLLSFFSFVLLATGCGSGAGVAYPTADSFPPSARFTPTEAPTGPEVGALAARFYGSGEFDPAVYDREIAALLERYPGNATLNEMAAEMAMLRGDMDGRFRFLMTAAADLGSPLGDLYLDLAFEVGTTSSQQTAARELLEELRTAHASPRVRVAATDRLIRLLKLVGDLEAARELTASLGMLDRFLLVGAFDNDQGKGFLERYAPELGIDLNTPMQGMLRPVEWRDANLVDDRGRVALGNMVTPARFSVAYLATWVRSPSARDAHLRLSTSCPVRAWVGGRLVASEENLTTGEIDDVVVSVRLERGWNLLLIKSATKGGGGWRLGARLTDGEGTSLTDLEVSTTPRDSAGASGVPGESDDDLEDLSLPAALGDIAEAARRSVIESRYRARSGRAELALEAAQAALEAAEGHPLTLFRAARAHWNHGEMGRAADLLNEGVDGSGRWAHAFRWKRGRFYSQRERYDRASEDLLAVVEAHADTRIPRLELAKVFSARGFLEDRCRVLEEILERWPDSAGARSQLGECLNSRRYIDEAEEAFRRAHALEPGNLSTLGWLAHFDRLRGRWDEAIRQRDRAREIAPESGSLILEAADVRRQAGRRDEARQLYRLIIERDPDWAQPWARLATMDFEDGNQDRAITAWQEALERNPDDSRLAERLDYYGAGDDAVEHELMPSDADIAAALAALDAATPHPGAHTLWGLDDEVTVVRQDGSAQRMVTQVMKALTTTGRDQLIQQRLPRNARILSAYVRTADGDRQEASSIRDGTVRFRRLDDGATVVLQYVTDSPSRGFLPNHFVSSWWFSGHHRQTVRGRWVILLPPGRPLVTRILGEIDHEE